ncbi:hypothetical protein N0V83_007158 [Neocucurbitaria cava]|uniref:Ankyrin n=1 Tax=Neocucurbitaria cava TaxID=798079 RepID=A0A9W9CKS4_9PLEO|nr:hypothetical protein N0V83_007158 [Neocucurbitaria cava]
MELDGAEEPFLEESRRATTEDFAAFVAAIRGGDIEVVESKLTLGVDIERETDDGNIALVISIKEDKVDIARLLLEEGADVHHRVRRLPPIVHAVMTNCAPQLIQLLVNHGANLNAVSGPDQMNALHWAAVEGKVDAVDFLASKGMDLNSASSKGRTSLILAAEKGHTTVAKLLLAKGAELLKRSDNGGTALAWAACNGYLDTVKYLLEEGIDVDDCDDCGLTALSVASNSGHVEVVEFLIEEGADINSLSVEPKHFTPAMAAAIKGRTDVIQAFIKHIPDFGIRNGNGETVLDIAMAEGHFETVHVLLGYLGGPNHPRDSVALHFAMANSYHAVKSLVATTSMTYLHLHPNPTQFGNFDWMSCVLQMTGFLVWPKAMTKMMHYALIEEQHDMIKALLAHGCDVDTYLPTGHTPILLATERQKPEIIRILLDAGADPAKPGRGLEHAHVTPLYKALVALEQDREKDTSLVDQLLSSGRCKLLQGKSFQRTAFSYIIRRFDEWDHGVAEILAFRMLEAVPDVTKERADDGSTLMHVAVQYNRQDLIDILLQKGVDINTPDHHGQTPFLMKCWRHQPRNLPSLLPFLLERGADAFAKDKEGRSALHNAAYQGSIATIGLLLSKGLDIDAVTIDGETPLICALITAQTPPRGVIPWQDDQCEDLLYHGQKEQQ